MVQVGGDERAVRAPQEHLAVAGAGGDARSVGGDRDGEELAPVARQRRQRGAVGDSPEAHRVIVAGGGERGAVGGDGERVDAAGVPHERSQLAPVHRVDQLGDRAGQAERDPSVGQVGRRADR